jgi:hypothetical protein
MSEQLAPTLEWYPPEALSHTEEVAGELRDILSDFDPEKVVIANYWGLVKAFEAYQNYGSNYHRYVQFAAGTFAPFIPINDFMARMRGEVSERETVLGSTPDQPRFGAELRISLDGPETPYVYRSQLGLVFSVAQEDFVPPPEVSLLRFSGRFVDPASVRFEGAHLLSIGDIHESGGSRRKRVSLEASPEAQATFLAGVDPDMNAIRSKLERLHYKPERDTNIDEAFAKIVELAGDRATEEELMKLRRLMSVFAEFRRPKPKDGMEVRDTCEGTTGDFTNWAKQLGVEIDQMYYYLYYSGGHTLNVWKDDIAIDWTGAQITAEGTHPLAYKLGDERYIYHGKGTVNVSVGGKRYTRQEFLEAFNYGRPL